LDVGLREIVEWRRHAGRRAAVKKSSGAGDWGWEEDGGGKAGPRGYVQRRGGGGIQEQKRVN